MNKTRLLLLLAASTTLAATGAEDKKDAKTRTENRSVTVQSSATSRDGGPATGKVVVTTDDNGNRETRTYAVPPPPASYGERRLLFRPPGAPSGPVTYLGVATGEVRDDLAAHLPIEKGTGLVALNVSKDGPAAAAGLQENDVLLKLDDQLLIHPQQLQVLVRNKKEGDKVELTFIRKGEKKTATATLTRREAGTEELHREIRLERGSADRPEHLEDVLLELNRVQAPIFHRQSVFVGPDGTARVVGDLPDLERIHRDVLEQLEKANIPADVREHVKKSLETHRTRR